MKIVIQKLHENLDEIALCARDLHDVATDWNYELYDEPEYLKMMTVGEIAKIEEVAQKTEELMRRLQILKATIRYSDWSAYD